MSAIPIQTLDLSAQGAYQTAPDVDLTAFAGSGQNIELLLVVSDAGGASPDGVVDFSFDGNVTHGELRRGTAIEAVTWETLSRKVWFKRIAGTNPVKVTIMGELKAK